MGKRILTVGEPMGLLIAQEEGGLDEVKHFTSAIAGAEFNVAVGLTRLGHTVGYLTRVGRDPFGRQICRYMKQIGLDTGLTRVDQGRRTGFMLQSRTSQGDPDIYYFRTGSAASALSNFFQWDIAVRLVLSKINHNAQCIPPFRRNQHFKVSLHSL